MAFYFSTLAILLLSLGCFLSISPALGKPAAEEEDDESEGDEDGEDGEANEDGDDHENNDESKVVQCGTMSLCYLGNEMIITETQILIQRWSSWAKLISR